VQATSFRPASRRRDPRPRRARRADISALGASVDAFGTVSCGTTTTTTCRQRRRAITLHDRRPAAGRATITHDRIDDDHSNSYAAWLKMGPPQATDAGAVRRAGPGRALQALKPAVTHHRPRRAGVVETFELPAQRRRVVRPGRYW
jgi:hypothetical protein